MQWPRSAIDFSDDLNRRIWSESPALQHAIQPGRTGTEGDTGAAQAMVGPTVLPWVPDIVGRRAHSAGGILVFGSSYADFFTRFAARTGRMRDVYHPDARCSAFQRSFLPAVVDDDPSYYDKVQQLLVEAGVSHDQVLLTDLCRASFVAIDNDRSSASESVLTSNADAFNAYVTANRPWHAERFDQWTGTVIVGLGRLATAGVLHLLCDGSSDDTHWMRRSPPLGVHPASWKGREVQVLHVPHPSAWGRDPRDGTEALRRLLDGDLHPAERRPPAPSTSRSDHPTEPDRTPPAGVWADAFRPAKSLAAAELLARHPRCDALTTQLLADLTVERVVAIANALYNPCRPSRLRDQGREQPEEAWRILMDRRNTPSFRSATKWERLIAALTPMPPSVARRIAAMDIEQIASLSAALIRGPYRDA